MGKTIEAIIFDLGGTLIEYAGPYQRWPELETPGLRAAYDHLRQDGAALPAFDQFCRTAFAILPGWWQDATEGKRNLRLVDYLGQSLAQEQVDDITPDMLDTAARAYQSAVCAQATMIADAPQTLQRLKNEGYKLALLSNTMFAGAAHIADLQRFGLDGYFDAVLFSADANKWKPSAAPYLHLLDELDVAPSRAVFVGDSPHHDIVGGKEAGLRTIFFHSSDRFGRPQDVFPDATIFGLDEMPELMARWSAGV